MPSNLRGNPIEKQAALLIRAQMALRRFWFIPVITTVVGLGIALFQASREPTWYRSTAKLIVSGRFNIGQETAYTEETTSFYGTQIELMRSAKLVAQAEERVKAMGRITTSKISSLDIQMVPATSIFSLGVTTQTAEYCEAFLNALINEYIEFKRGMRTQKSESTVALLNDELVRLDKELQKGEDEKIEWQRENSLIFLRENENAAARYLSNLNDQLAALNSQKLRLERVDLDGPLPPVLSTPKDADQPQIAPPENLVAKAEYSKARQDLRLLEESRKELLQTLREGHEEILAIDENIASTKRLLVLYKDQAKEEQRSKIQAIEAQIKTVQEEVEGWKTKALEISRNLADYERLQTKVDRTKTLYNRLLASVGNVDLTKSLDQDVISVLEAPSSAFSVRPGLDKKATTGALLGLLVGMVALVLMDRLSGQIASPEEFAGAFDETILGTIPYDPDANHPLQTNDPRHAFAESFYNLRSSLFFLPYDGPMPKIILVTSAIPNEGKSTICANIASAFAFAGSKTLLIDGDLRRGEVHKTFNRSNEVGFSDVLQGKIKWQDAVIDTDIPNLSIIPRGSRLAQPSKFLVHSSTDELFKALHGEYDHVILDTCPVLAADDTTSVAPKAEAVIVVSRIGKVTRQHVATTLAALNNRQANILGVVINAVDTRATAYRYYSYTQYYNQLPAVSGGKDS